MTVAERGHIGYDGDVEAGFVLDHGVCVFDDLVVQDVLVLIHLGLDGIEGTDTNASSASDTRLLVKVGGSVRYGDGILSTY